MRKLAAKCPTAARHLVEELSPPGCPNKKLFALARKKSSFEFDICFGAKSFVKKNFVSNSLIHLTSLTDD